MEELREALENMLKIEIKGEIELKQSFNTASGELLQVVELPNGARYSLLKKAGGGQYSQFEIMTWVSLSDLSKKYEQTALAFKYSADLVKNQDIKL